MNSETTNTTDVIGQPTAQTQSISQESNSTASPLWLFSFTTDGAESDWLQVVAFFDLRNLPRVLAFGVFDEDGTPDPFLTAQCCEIRTPWGTPTALDFPMIQTIQRVDFPTEFRLKLPPTVTPKSIALYGVGQSAATPY
ncbi:MAG: hypothetical protein JNM58_00690 [Xanthomonadaceae bacterium]|nr:hypothetical protein [Xanthomonadaceae bacterium]